MITFKCDCGVKFGIERQEEPQTLPVVLHTALRLERVQDTSSWQLFNNDELVCVLSHNAMDDFVKQYQEKSRG